MWDRMKTIVAVVQADNETKDQTIKRAQDIIDKIPGKPITPKKEPKSTSSGNFYTDPHAIGTEHKYKSNGFDNRIELLETYEAETDYRWDKPR